RDEARDLWPAHQKLHADPGSERDAAHPDMRRIGVERVHPVEHGGCVREFSGAGIEGSLAAANTTKVEPDSGAAETVEHVKEVIDQRIVHRSAELRMGMQNHSHRGARRLLALVAHLDAARGTGKNYVRHRPVPHTTRNCCADLAYPHSQPLCTAHL